MRRDMDLIRSMLRTVADSDAPMDAQAFTDDAHPFPVIAYHADLLRQFGLADVFEVKDAGGEDCHRRAPVAEDSILNQAHRQSR